MTTPSDLTAFVRIHETGSFAAAAPGLGLTASAVSKLVTRIEDRLGVRLITRTTRRLALTPEGETFLGHARDILAAIEAAEAAIVAGRDRPRGLIRVNTGTAIARHQFSALLPAFCALYPEIDIELSVTDRMVDLVTENVDVVLRTGPLADSSLIARKLADSHRLICASPAYLARHGTPQTPGDLLAHNCIVITGMARLARWPFHTPEGVNHLEVKGHFTCDNADVLLEQCIRGLGIARFGDMLCSEAVRRGDLVPILRDAHMVEPFPIWALTLPGRLNVPRLRVFVDFLVETFRPAPWRIA